MIMVCYNKGFVKDFRKLPKSIRIKGASVELFRDFPFHPSLKTKKLQGSLQHLYSFRITRDYRVIFQFTSPEEVEFLAVKHRKDIYK